MNNDSDKSLIRIDHFELLKSIFKRKNTAVFYTDGTYDTNTKIATSSCVLYQNSNVLTKAWNLGRGMNINDAELYAIHKSMKWAQFIDSKDI